MFRTGKTKFRQTISKFRRKSKKSSLKTRKKDIEYCFQKKELGQNNFPGTWKAVSANLPNFFCQISKTFRPKFENNLTKTIQSRKKIFSYSQCPSGHSPCSFDNHVTRKMSKIRKCFAQGQKNWRIETLIFTKKAVAWNNSPVVQNVGFTTLSSFIIQKSSKVSPKKRENLWKIRLSQSTYCFSSETFPETHRLQFWQTWWKFFTNSFEVFRPKPIKVEQKFVLKKSFLKTILVQRKWSFDNHASKLLSKLEKCFGQCLNLFIKKDFWTSWFCSTWSPRHVDCTFENPVRKFFLKVLKVFAQCPERFLSEQKIRNRSFSSKNSSRCVEVCFDNLAEKCPPKSKNSFG